jgi:hypothetical protein
MEKVWAAALVAAIVLATFAMVPAALANQIQDGTVVDLKGANDLGKTFDFYIRNYGVQILGSVVAIGGATQLGSRPGVATGGIGGGVVMMFIPSIIGSGTTQAQAFAGRLLGWSPQMLIQSGQLIMEASLMTIAARVYQLRHRRSLA